MKSTNLMAGLFLLLVAGSCNEAQRHTVGEKELVAEPRELKVTVSEVLEVSLEEAVENDGRLPNLRLRFPELVQSFYEANAYSTFWTRDSNWLGRADSLRTFIASSRNYGLFPEDYYSGRIDSLYARTVLDTSRLNRLDAALWAETELVLSSAFISLVGDLKTGRLRADSVRRADSTLTPDFFQKQMALFGTIPADSFATALEPRHPGYRQLREAIPAFLESADLRTFTYIDLKDSLNRHKLVARRLLEDSIHIPGGGRDSLAMAKAVRQFQKNNGLKADGKLSPALISHLNDTDAERFIRIAITLDRYKNMAPPDPKYIWVNIPAYKLYVYQNDTVVLTSKVVVGKPQTRTPLLTSRITDMITYPLWYIPASIIEKEILPALKKDPGYLARKGFSLQDKGRSDVSPYTVNWAKYEKNIPFHVVQGKGDDNALGVMKFNFPNEHAVYLHDTNQRHLFGSKRRDLSHGCVRVELWNDLACYLLAQDTAAGFHKGMDSVQVWLDRKEKHVIPLRNKLSLYIRYFTCEAGKEKDIIFHEDIYGEDRKLRLQYFATK